MVSGSLAFADLGASLLEATLSLIVIASVSWSATSSALCNQIYFGDSLHQNLSYSVVATMYMHVSQFVVGEIIL